MRQKGNDAVKAGSARGAHARRLAFALACAALLGVTGAQGEVRAATAALWVFDASAEVSTGAVVRDAGPQGYSLILENGAELVPGKFGQAVRFTGGEARVRWAHFASATDTKLNLGAHDWTIECWLRLDAAAGEEGTIFEIGIGPRWESEILTRFSVLPRENAFALTGIATRRDVDRGAAAKAIELPNPAGPPAITARVFTSMLGLATGELRRDAWCHVALVHGAAGEELRLFVDGRLRAASRVTMDALPRGDDAYAVIGCDGRGGRRLRGMMDELRISRVAVYNDEFVPPASFARRNDGGR